jgi:hypothetical protein
MHQPDLFFGDAASPEGEHAVTPAWLVHAVLAHVPAVHGASRVLDPGAGTGAIGREVERWQRTAGQAPVVTALDALEERRGAWPSHWTGIHADFFRWSQQAEQAGLRWDVIVTNPPFSRWTEWVTRCLALLAAGGDLVAIGPLAYLGGDARAEWWRAQPPARVLISPRRPRGQGWGNTRDIMAAHWHRRPTASRAPELRWLVVPETLR